MKAAREFVDSTLTKHLPPAWKVLADEAGLPDVLDRITVRVMHQRVRRAPEAPMGSYDHTILVRLISHKADVTQAETDLEAAMDVLLRVIEDHLGTAWDEATKVLDPDTDRLAWDVPVHVITTRED